MKPPAPSRTSSVLQSAPAGLPPALRPTFLDYFLILLGCSLSLYLVELSGYQAHESENAAEHVPFYVHRLLPLLPRLLFLPLGVLLCWPLFYTTQRIVGRPAALTPGEWLWGFAWLGAVGLVTWIAWQTFPDAPEAIKTREIKGQIFAGYAVTVLSLAAIALLIGFLSLFSRQRQPWTNAFGLVLLIWQALPVVGLLALKLQVE